MLRLTPRHCALIAGLAYLAMTVIALTTAFDAAGVTALLDGLSEGAPWPDAVRRGLFALYLGSSAVALLDLVIAAAAYRLFQEISITQARLMAITRVIYALIYLVALQSVLRAHGVVRAGPIEIDSIRAVLDAMGQYRMVWDIGFLVFGVHLALLGVLVLGTEWPRLSIARVLAALLVIAGAGYFADSVLALAFPAVGFRIAPYTFVGEMAVMIWFLVLAARPPEPDAA